MGPFLRRAGSVKILDFGQAIGDQDVTMLHAAKTAGWNFCAPQAVFQTAACPDRISVRTAFICVTFAVTSPQERIYISAGET
jgi:hypothetical protein